MQDFHSRAGNDGDWFFDGYGLNHHRYGTAKSLGDVSAFHYSMGPLDLGQFFSDTGYLSSFSSEKTFGRSGPGGGLCAWDVLCRRSFRSVAFLRADFPRSALGWGDVAFCDAVLKSSGNVSLSSPTDKSFERLNPFCLIENTLDTALLIFVSVGYSS